MCIRTVDGDDITEDSLRTVDGEDSFIKRNVSGVVSNNIVLLNTIPTTTVINAPASGTYTPPVGCIYFEVYLSSGGGGGSGGGAATNDHYGGGGGGGNIAYGIFSPGSYSYVVNGGGAGGPASTNASNGLVSTFHTMSAGVGEGGRFMSNVLSLNQGRKGLSSTNSLIAFGSSPSQPTGPSPSNGGMDMFYGGYARAAGTAAATVGENGFYSGASGGTDLAQGGDGGAGKLLIIEYY
jgi:hypothetical protein